MTGTIEQRYGTEGGTFPKQSLKELDIKADGRITFNFTYYYLDLSFNILKTEVFATGQLNKEKLVFRIDKPDTNGFNLDIVK
ncbi:MAG: hypothetical protein A2W85_05140 [Bacteroidetes bacterium GWF2_41_31]|nr:MAG: hypothetical protein A2W85_05140 [Bacteroidetes bacterium GWF2_41_31]